MIKQSTPTLPKAKEPKSFLFIGPPGGGKTTTAMQFPSVCFLDMERNLDGPERFVRSQNKELSYSYIPVTFDDTGKAREAHIIFDMLLAEIDKLRDNKDIKTIVVDNLTMVNEYIIRKVLHEQKKVEMEARHWQPFKSNMVNLLVGKLRGTGKTTICTCHEAIIEKSNKEDMMNPTITGYRPAINGGIADYFGGFFTDMYRFTSEAVAGGKIAFKIQTVRDSKSDLKNTLGIPAVLDVPEGTLAWTKLEPYLRGVV